MRHAMFQDHRTLGSAENFAIYGHDSHLGHVSKTILHKLSIMENSPCEIDPLKPVLI